MGTGMLPISMPPLSHPYIMGGGGARRVFADKARCVWGGSWTFLRE